MGQGLSPYPPELATVSGEANPKELFWIVKNGIKMTGMPAFGVTHTDPREYGRPWPSSSRCRR